MTDECAYDVKSLAAKWKCSTDSIYDMIDAGTVRTFTIGKPDKKRKTGLRISATEVARCEGEQENESRLTAPAAGPSGGMAKRLLRSAARAVTASG